MERPAVVTGYSGTPLAKKLGIKQGSCILRIDSPPQYEKLLEPMLMGVSFVSRPSQQVDLAHVFVTQQGDLIKRLSALREKLKTETPVWVSWPKKAAKVPTTVTEDTIREAALPMGYVDTKVCAVSEVWSALKLVVRKELR